MAWFRAATGVARHALRRSLIARATAGTSGTSATRSAGFGTSALSRRASAPARRAVPLTRLTDSFLDGTSSVYLEELQRAWEADPSSVDESWDNFFRNLLGQAAPSAGLSGQTIQESMQHLLLVRAYQVNGHMKARLDPLGLDDRSVLEGFDLSNYGFTESDLDREFFLGVWKISGLFENRLVLTLREILSKLEQKYCGPIGFESMKCTLLRDIFQSDVVVHLICCPQFGHSEIDEPSSTQPKTCKATSTQCAGRQVLPFGSSSASLSKSNRMLALGTSKRRFSSKREQAPVIRQLVCYDEYEIKNEEWFSLAECFDKGAAILKPISPTGLMRPEDVLRCGRYETATFCVHLLRQGSGLIAANELRGCNVYRALYDTVDDSLSLTTGYSLADFPYTIPLLLDHFLEYLLDADITDKRLITNHTVTLFPGERIQRNLARNHVLRYRLPHEFGRAGRRRALKVYAELGDLFPPELLSPEGLHPAIDCWARTAQELRGYPTGTPYSSAPVIVPLSAKGDALVGWLRKVFLGKVLVALIRDPFEHAYQPVSDRVRVEPICQSTYTLGHIDNLLSNILPLYGPKEDECFLVEGIDFLLDTDSSNKQPYHSWTNISWAKKGHPVPVRSRAKPYVLPDPPAAQKRR